jgi:hypothetical protein
MFKQAARILRKMMDHKDETCVNNWLQAIKDANFKAENTITPAGKNNVKPEEVPVIAEAPVVVNNVEQVVSPDETGLLSLNLKINVNLQTIESIAKLFGFHASR